MLKNKKGFTLIEILVVVAIVGLLAVLAVVALNSARKNARDIERVGSMKQVQVEMERVFSENNSYELSGCTTSGVAVSSCTTPLSNYLPGIASIKDPVASKTCLVENGVCVDKVPCDYTVAVDPNNSDYKFCFYTEGEVGNLTQGMHYISPLGIQ
ncbi:MAG TPA: prepilin-type N-terminal cleavage/methylation domain-containing protein [Patescibacteria group bacterium]|nr:prepilin-type N-terminal cleavage/methylation domain-containing protein [Patescibacteria group bacterium]